MSLHAHSASPPKCLLLPQTCLLSAGVARGRMHFEPLYWTHLPLVITRTCSRQRRRAHTTGTSRRGNMRWRNWTWTREQSPVGLPERAMSPQVQVCIELKNCYKCTWLITIQYFSSTTNWNRIHQVSEQNQRATRLPPLDSCSLPINSDRGAHAAIVSCKDFRFPNDRSAVQRKVLSATKLLLFQIVLNLFSYRDKKHWVESIVPSQNKLNLLFCCLSSFFSNDFFLCDGTLAINTRVPYKISSVLFYLFFCFVQTL